MSDERSSALDFQGLFDASPNPYLVLDRCLHIVGANKAYLDSVKRALSDIVGRWAWDAFPTDPETERLAVASFERVIQSKRPDTMALLRFDVPRPEAEGGGMEKRYWSITHSPVFDVDGAVSLILQHPIDVTDLERLRDELRIAGEEKALSLEPAHSGIFNRAQSVYEANLALKEESDRLRAMFAQAPSFMAILRGPEHRYEMANESYTRLIGGRRVVGMPIREALSELDGQVFFDLLDRVYATGEPFLGRGMEVVLKGAGTDSDRRFLDFIYQPLVDRDGKVSGIFVEGADVTERRLAEEALHELNVNLEHRINATLEERNQLWRISRDPFLIADRAGRWLRASPAWTELLGWTENELTGRTSEWMEHLEDQSRTRAVTKELAAGNVTQRFENRFRAKDGRYRWFSWMAVPVDGLTFCVARDVTEEKHQADILQKTMEQLHQSQKMEVVGQLTGGMAHDFNNLLQAMSGCLQLVGRRAGSVEGLGTILDAGRQAVDRGARMIRQLMAFSRHQRLQPEAFDVRDRLLGMHVFLDRVLRADIQLTFDLKAGVWPVLADPVQFELAVLNLATNARDAIKEEGRLVIGAENVQPGIGEPSGAFVRVWVRDNGQGMAPETLERVFEPFFTTKAIGEGTGLGLAQVYGFCRQSGGSATVESVEGQGTTLSLLLPRAAGLPNALNEGVPALVMGDGSRLLVVEDDPVVAPVITAALQDLGYEVERAANGEEAVHRLKHGEVIDLLFTDVVMPGEVNGIALAALARQLRPGLAVVLTTGYSEALSGLNGLCVLPKPYKVEELAEIIHREIKKAKEQKLIDALGINVRN